MPKKINVEVSPTQVKRLKEPFTLTSPNMTYFMETLSLEELLELKSDIEAAVAKYEGIVNV